MRFADNPGDVMDRLPTAPIAAAGLIAGYAVAVATGSRPLGGLVLALCGVACIVIWLGVITSGRLIAYAVESSGAASAASPTSSFTC